MPPPGKPPRDEPGLPRETGGFRLLRTLGRGGMGIVYEAEELASGRRVALKVLAQELSVSEEAFERFRREARIAASISDSACVFVFGAHQIDGAPAIAMELCAGETLQHRLASGEPVPIADAVRWTIEILDGLEAAHRAGVVHRDVKPSNCFFTAEGRVKVGDFGLSRSLEQDVQLTRSGVFLGSPLYASPEQVRGRGADLRSDLYSVGATLYALLTGRSPYLGVNLGEVLARILSEPPEPPRQLRPEIPRGLEKVILRAMAREPSQRFTAHAEMREALREYALTSRTAASPLRRLCAYLLDAGALALLQVPIMGIWTHFDPNAIKPVDNQPWRPQSAWLVVTLGLLGPVYFSISEGLFGRTLGKWITGQRIVLVGDASRGVALRVLRVAIWSAPGLASVLVDQWLQSSSASSRVTLLTNLLPLIGILLMLSTMRRRNGWRGVHELLSRTRVVAEPLPFSRFVRQKAPPRARLESSGEFPAKLGGYSTVGRVDRTPSGELFEASDTGLERRVWIHIRDQAARPIAPERRSVERATRLRWLDGFDEGGRRHEVFEAPGGARFLDCCAGEVGLSWPTTHGVLSSLAEESDLEPSSRISLDQLWIDRSWNLRILDEPLGDRPSTPREPLEILAHAARASLGSSPASVVQLPPDLPEHAEGVARRLLGLDAPFESLAESRAALSRCASRPQGLTWKIRGLQMLLGSGIITLSCGFILLSIQVFVVPQARELGESGDVLREVRAGREFSAEDFELGKSVPTGPALDPEGTRARSILIAGIEIPTGGFQTKVTMKLSEDDRKAIARAREESGPGTPEEHASARALVASRRPANYDPSRAPSAAIIRKMAFVMPFVFASLWAILGILGSLILRGGFSLRLVSIAVRDTRGHRAGRLRCAGRALLSAIPVVAIYFLPLLLGLRLRPMLGGFALAAAALVHAAFVFQALRHPARGWQDRLAGTRLVPR